MVEDEPDLRKSIKIFLYQDGYVVESAPDLKGALDKSGSFDYDCILVDIGLPDGSGMDLIKKVKETHPNTGIIVISARNSLDDKLQGLEQGADDYLAKPFHLSELNARIKALIRRRNYAGRKEITINEIIVFPEERKVMIHGGEVVLTRKEFDLLLYFISNKNRVVSKSAIAEHLKGDDNGFDDNHDFIYTHLKNMRKKIEEKGGKDYIETVYGIGYKFRPQE